MSASWLKAVGRFQEKRRVVDIGVLETAKYEVDSRGRVEYMSLKGKITAQASKPQKRLQVFLSNTHRISKLVPTSLVTENSLPFGRTVVFNLPQGESTLLLYEIDCTYAPPPITVSIQNKVSKNKVQSKFTLTNTMDYSSIMGNTLVDLQANISIPDNAINIDTKPEEEAKYVEQNSEVVWNLQKVEYQRKKRLNINFEINEEILGPVAGKISIRFDVANRTLSQIFIEKVQPVYGIFGGEIPVGLIYQTRCENHKTRFDYLEGKPLFRSEKPSITLDKSVDGDSVYCKENLEVRVVAKNIGKRAARNVKISDIIPAGFEFVRGNYFWLGQINPDEARELVYVISPTIPGNYQLPSAKATYYDFEGRKYESMSLSPITLVSPMRKITLKCNSCGAELPESAVYCGKCGKKIE